MANLKFINPEYRHFQQKVLVTFGTNLVFNKKSNDF